jgi:hypothetical protein
MSTLSRVLAAVGCSAALVACGSSGKSGTGVASSRYAQALRHADCMRSHGVPSFPDPSANGAPNGPGSGISLASPAFRSAVEACRALAPDGAAVPKLTEGQKLIALKFSQCMRAHGVKNYPDPQFSAMGYRLTLPPGLSQNSPALKSAQATCDSSAGVGSGNS